MKRAGAKNDGAWFRSNKVLVNLSGLQRVTLGNIIKELPNANNAYNAIAALAAETGIDNGVDFPADVEAWVASMLGNGIPRQVWFGHLSFTTYHKEGTGEDAVYTPNYQDEMRQFGYELRKTVRNFIFALREVNDLTNLGALGDNNPGGLPNANPEE